MISIYVFWASFTLVTGIYYSTWLTSLSLMGFPLEDAAITYAFFVLGQALFEVPTGSLADKYGRKLITLCGVFLHILAFLGVFLSSSKWSLYGFLLIAGFGQTLLSGAYHAWFLDVSEKYAASSKNALFSNMDLIRRINLVVGALLGATLLKSEPRVLWFVMSLLSALALLLGFLAKGDNIIKNDHFTVLSKCNLITFEWLKNTTFIGLLVMGFFYGIEIGNRDIIMQPFVVDNLGKGNPFGMVIIQGGVALFGILGNRMGARFRRKKPEELGKIDFQMLMVPLVIMGFSQLLMAFSNNLLAFCIPYFVGICAIGWFYPSVNAFLSKVVKAKDRAKAFSALGMFESTAASITCIVISQSAIFKTHEYGQLWIVGAIALFIGFIAVAITWMSLSKLERVNENPKLSVESK